MPKGIYPHKIKHGMSESPTYNSWRSMVSRCKYPRHTSFAYCGGRGISVCERWLIFSNFLADLGSRPSLEHSVDRIDNSGNYEPGNCRWATRAEQQRNMNQTIRITIDGETMCATDWAERVGIKPSTVLARITKMKWDPVDAVTTPLQLNQWAEGRRRTA
jgi:hypothetical protein